MLCNFSQVLSTKGLLRLPNGRELPKKHRSSLAFAARLLRCNAKIIHFWAKSKWPFTALTFRDLPQRGFFMLFHAGRVPSPEKGPHYSAGILQGIAPFCFLSQGAYRILGLRETCPALHPLYAQGRDGFLCPAPRCAALKRAFLPEAEPFVPRRLCFHLLPQHEGRK